MKNNIFEGYGFVQSNTFGIISEINKEDFKDYYCLLSKLKCSQDLYIAYRNVQMQYNLFVNLADQYSAGKINDDNIFKILESVITAYIMLHRTFVENCKAFGRIYSKAKSDISNLIIDLQNKESEQNIKVLRDYAMHTSIPMSNISIGTVVNYKKNSLKTMSVEIIAKKMDKHDLSNWDKQIIDNWKYGKLEIIKEINNTWNNLQVFSRKVFHAYINSYISENLIKKVQSDKKLWMSRLIPYRTIGITYQPKNSIPKQTIFMDNDALAYCINILLEN